MKQAFRNQLQELVRKMSKKIVASIIIIILIISGLYYGTITGAFLIGEEAIAIGLSTPLSGSGASWGNEVKKGAEIAIDEINNQKVNGKTIKFIIEDDKCDSKEAINAYQKLTSMDKAKIIAGAICSSATLGVAPLAQKDKVLLISTGASNPKIRNAGNYVFSLWPLDDEEGKAMAEYVSKTEYKKISVLFINNEYGVGLKEVFEKEAKKLGITIASSQPFEKDSTDFKTQIEKTKNANPQAIYIASNPEEMPLILKQIKEFGINKPIFANGVAIETKEILTQNPLLGEGIIYPMPKSNINEEFKSKYRKKYGEESGLIAAKGYDTIRIIWQAMNNCNGDNTECMQNYIHNLKGYDGVGGELNFNQTSSISSPFEIRQIKNGKMLKIG